MHSGGNGSWRRAAVFGFLGLAMSVPSFSDEPASRSQARFSGTEVETVVVSAPRPPLQPGELVDLGLTYDLGGFRAPLPGAAPRAATPVLRPGEGPGGKALFNPNREYRPGWDSTLVPGYSMPYGNSRGDYREGRTLAYPPGNGQQQTPGAPPTMMSEGVDTPKVLTTPGGWSPPPIGPSIQPPVMARSGWEAPRVPDAHDVPRVSYDPNLPPPGTAPPPPPSQR